MSDLKRCISTGGLFHLTVGGTYKVQQIAQNGDLIVQADDAKLRAYPSFLFVNFPDNPALPVYGKTPTNGRDVAYSRGASVEGFLMMLSNELTETGYRPSDPMSRDLGVVMASKLLELLLNARLMKVDLPAAVRALLENR